MLFFSPEAGGVFFLVFCGTLHLTNAMCITLCSILELYGECGVPLENRDLFLILLDHWYLQSLQHIVGKQQMFAECRTSSVNYSVKSQGEEWTHN